MISSAPHFLHISSFVSEDAQAITVAPKYFAISIAADPTPPEAPRIRTTSFFSTFAKLCKACHEVPYVSVNAAAVFKDMELGSGIAILEFRIIFSAKPP